MPTRKQRRRRQKEQRHEYEYVYVDDEGHEVEAQPDETAQDKRANGKPATAPASGRGGRKLEPASWTRVGKRALWVGPLMFLTLTLIATELTLEQRVRQTLFMLALFLPVSYMMDRALYRASVKRGLAGDAKKR